jgi:hypothetical protein
MELLTEPQVHLWTRSEYCRMVEAGVEKLMMVLKTT